MPNFLLPVSLSCQKDLQEFGVLQRPRAGYTVKRCGLKFKLQSPFFWCSCESFPKKPQLHYDWKSVPKPILIELPSRKPEYLEMHCSALTKSALLWTSEYLSSRIKHHCSQQLHLFLLENLRQEDGISLLYGFQLNAGAFTTTSYPTVTPQLLPRANTFFQA